MGLSKTEMRIIAPMALTSYKGTKKVMNKFFPNTGGAIAKGGASGAAAGGAAGGPWGALIGGVIGAGVGGYTKYKSNERDRNQQVSNAHDKAAQEDEMTKGAFERQRQQEEILKSIMMEGYNEQ